ncbi:MAG: YkgJ family cysteine cluster protein [Thiotrichales bacterium]|jgi:hypothetical protein|nr:YkgJ family cysteine cluster protein [Pseudomonadota bacterium]MCI4410216.1 YkgJ family cysteine cluster protein [Thiotrichales bacterium]
MKCRDACAACCIAPSISSPLPKMPNGKPAGTPCPHLDSQLRCALFDKPERPKVCASLQPSLEMCGSCQQDALSYLTELERLTR